jgi:hypothetical protein
MAKLADLQGGGCNMAEQTRTAATSGGDITGIDVSQAEIERSLRELAHENIWMNYDQERDSLTMYFTGQPVDGLNVHIGDDHHVIVDPHSRRVVGFFLENVVRLDKLNGR